MKNRINLTGAEIKEVAEFAGLSISVLDADELETEWMIEDCHEKGIDADGKTEFYHYVMYLADYPEEGVLPIGPELDKPPQRIPIDMLLFCPRCFQQHIDRPQPEKSWTNPPHRSHQCQECGHIWRPCDHHTNGVESLKTAGKNDGSSTPGIDLNEETLFILGRPNFACSPLAYALRRIGYDIRTRSEDEQAAVIHWMLNLYLKHGKDWRVEADNILSAAEETKEPC